MRVRSGGAEQIADPFELVDGAHVVVRDVAPGDAELEIGGPGWLPQKRHVKIAKDGVVEEPLDVLPAATVLIDWSTSDKLQELDRSLGSCDAQPNDNARIEVSLGSCCHESYPPDQTSGSLLARDIVPGSYRAKLRFGNLPPVEVPVTAQPLRQTSAILSAYYHELDGELTFGGKPIGKNVTLRFPGGIGFASKEETKYHALIRDRVNEDDAIEVAACDGSIKATVLADHSVFARGGRLDIDIPVNELTVRVIDTFTQEPVESATVSYAVLSSRVRRPVLRGVLTKGTATNLPDRDIRLTVSAPHYETREVAPFHMTENKSVEVQLVPRRAGHGRIVSDQRFESAMIAWYAASGKEIEHADLGADGTFAYALHHDANELMAVVSRSHPLWVARSLELDPKATPELAFPTRMRPVTLRNPPQALVQREIFTDAPVEAIKDFFAH